MKTLIAKLYLKHIFVTFVIATAAVCTQAQTFTTLHNFNGNDGDSPYGDLTLSGNKLYGTTGYGGSMGNGTIFAINTDGTGFTNLHNFSGSDGAGPNAKLVLSSNKLYGTTLNGGPSDKGTMFSINTDGSGFTNLYFFTATTSTSPRTNSDGAEPQGGLTLSEDTLYGTATFGGITGGGTIFAINTDGTDFRVLHTFESQGYPSASMILVGDSLYGTSTGGGNFGAGAVFVMSTNGGSFTNLYSFSPSIYTSVYGYFAYTNSDGEYPQCVLTLSNNTLYGTTPQCGTADHGVVFAVKTDGTEFTNLHNFSPTISYRNSDGQRPDAGVILSGNTLYGTTEYGGKGGNGVVYAINTDGSDFTTIHTFSATPSSPYTNYDGGGGYAGLVSSGTILYGAAYYGGNYGKGTLFSISLAAASAPQLTIAPANTNVILTWPTNAFGFILQYTTNLVPPAVWITNNLPSPVVVNGQNTVTNVITGNLMYYRLSH